MKNFRKWIKKQVNLQELLRIILQEIEERKQQTHTVRVSEFGKEVGSFEL